MPLEMALAITLKNYESYAQELKDRSKEEIMTITLALRHVAVCEGAVF